MTKKDIIFSLAIVILLVFSILNYTTNKQLKGKMYEFTNLQMQLQGINDSIHSITSQVNMSLDEIKKEELWIQKKGYETRNADLENNKIDVTIHWSLREIFKNEEIRFLYREKSEQNWTELGVKQHGGLNYSVESTFPLRGNYETQVLATSENGQRSENLVPLNFKEELESRIQINGMIHQVDPKHIDVNVDIFNPTEMNFFGLEKREDLEIKSATGKLYIEDKLIKEIDFLKENQHTFQHERMITFNEILTIEEMKEIHNAELYIVVEDHLGLTYEHIAEVKP